MNDANGSPTDVAESSSAISDVSAESSPAKGETLSDVIREAVNTASQAEKSETTEADETPTEEAHEEAAVEESKQEKDFSKHPRFQELIAERNQLREQQEKLKPLAETGELFSEYCRRTGLGQEEIMSALELQALASGNRAEYRARLQKLIDAEDVSTGTRLPSDLQSKVDSGTIDEETAKELARLRLRADTSEDGLRRAQHRNAAVISESITGAVNAWEITKKASDPDYERRSDFMRDRIAAIIAQRGAPTSPKAAVAIVEEAYAEVKKRITSLIPKPLTARHRNGLNGHTSSNNNEDLGHEGDLRKIIAARVEQMTRDE